nr:nucleotidyl transferase AbiEii/AbiGii toxin family protein [Micromonospora sp. 4G51]
MDQVHLRLAEIGLRVAARYGFALAGGYAVQAHGILDRPSEDVDLFTAWERRGEFAAAVDAVVDGYRDGGYSVEVTQQFDTFARLTVTDPAQPEHPYKVELAANWRALPPVMMDVGPVLHADDVVAGKMSALYTRAEPRDFLDIDAALVTGRYPDAAVRAGRTVRRGVRPAHPGGPVRNAGALPGPTVRRLRCRPRSHRRDAQTLRTVAR